MDEDKSQSIAYTRFDARTAAALDQRVVSLESNVSNLIKAIEKLNTSFESLARSLMHSEKTNWPLFVSVVAVAITLIAGLGWMWIRPLESRIERIETNRYSIQDEPQNVRIDLLKEEMERQNQQIERLRNQVKNAQ